MKFVSHFVDGSSFESEDMTAFNKEVMSKDASSIDFIVGKDTISFSLVDGSFTKNGNDYIKGLGEMELQVIGKLKPKIFRRTKVVIGSNLEPEMGSKYFVGWVGNGKEQFVVFDGKDFTTTESR